MRPGSTPRRFTFRPSCRAAFGGPRQLSRPGFRRRCGPPGRAFQLSGLKIGRLRNVLHTNSFCWIIAGGASASMPVPGLNRDRRFGAGFIVRGVRSNLARRYGPRLLFVVWEFGARAFGIASPSLAVQVNGGNASRSSVWCGYSAPQPPKNFKRIWAAGQAK